MKINLELRPYILLFESIDELLEKTKGLIGKTFGDIDKLDLLKKLKKDKGVLGKVIETGFYEYPLNNLAQADFENLGVELKVSGFQTLKKGGWSAKERISLSQINYNTIVNEEFEFSSVITKSRKLLFVWYEYIKGVDKKDFVIRDFQLYDLTKVEPIIRNDYYMIQSKVKAGLAHKLTEGESVILGAATKGASGQTQSQPFSSIPAPTRAFSLKNSFLRGVLNEHHENRTTQLTTQLSPAKWVWDKIKSYKGIKQLDILKMIDSSYTVSSVPKNLNDMLIKRIIGSNKELNQHEIFSKSTYLIKNIPIDKNYFPIEKATFHTLNISDFEDSWENSEWKLFFEESTFLYIGYIGKDANNKKLPNGKRILHCLFKVTFTADEIIAFGKTYNLIKQAIEQHDLSQLPTATKYPDIPLVLSTKGIGGDSCYEQFFAGKNKVCFMFNKKFIHQKFVESEVIL